MLHILKSVWHPFVMRNVAIKLQTFVHFGIMKHVFVQNHFDMGDGVHISTSFFTFYLLSRLAKVHFIEHKQLVLLCEKSWAFRSKYLILHALWDWNYIEPLMKLKLSNHLWYQGKICQLWSMCFTINHLYANSHYIMNTSRKHGKKEP